MTNFNLLPSEYKKKSVTLRQVLLYSILVIILILVAKYGFYQPIENRKMAHQKLAALKKESLDYSDLEQEEMELKATIEELEQRVLVVQEMEKGMPQYWIGVLDTLIHSQPYNSYIKSFTCDNNTILLVGNCNNDRTAAIYLRSLQDSGYFSETCMEKIVYQQSEVCYTIRCILKSDAQGRMVP